MKCDRDGCPNQAAKMERYCKDALCIRVREAVAKRAADKAAPKRETGPIVSRDEETAKAASAPKPTQAEVPATKAGTLPREPEDLEEDEDEETESIHDEEPKEEPRPARRKPGPKPGSKMGHGPRNLQGRYWQAVIKLEAQLLEDCVAAGNRRFDHAAAWLGISKMGLKSLIQRTGFDVGRIRMSREEMQQRLMASQEMAAMRRLIAKTTNPRAKQALEAALDALEAES